MGLFNSSRSTTQQINETSDERAVVDNGSISLNLDDGAQASVSVGLTDYGALEQASKLAEAAMYGSAIVSAGQNATARELGLRAFEANKDTFDYARGTSLDALGFAGESQRDAVGLVRDALGLSESALRTGTNAARDASTLAVRAYDDQAQTASGNRTLVIGALIVAGLVAMQVLGKR